MSTILTRLVLDHGLSLYISQEKGDHYYIQTRHNDLFFPLQSYSKETFKKKMPRKALVNTKRNVLMPPGHPIII